MNPYLCASSCATQLERYRGRFQPGQILVIDSTDLRDRRRATLREIWSFLGADPDFESPTFDEQKNVAYRKLPGPLAAARRHRLVLSVQGRIPASLYPTMARSTRRLFGGAVERPVLDEELQSRLRDALREEVRRLRELTGKEFASWSV